MLAIRSAVLVIQAVARGRGIRRGPILVKEVVKTEGRQLDRYLEALRTSQAPQGGFQEWCTVRIQAWLRGLPLKWRFQRRGYAVYQIAGLQIQGCWREYRDRQRQMRLMALRRRRDFAERSPEDGAAWTIQDKWRRYANGRIYRYYRDLIRFRLVGDPAKLLKTINPSEARLLDRATGAHLRFRLGGASFPPMMYYKLFLHSPLCDLGAFAPRNYALGDRPSVVADHEHPHLDDDDDDADDVLTPADHRVLELDSIRVGSRYFAANVKNLGKDGTKFWYKRVENNDWRPVSIQTLADVEAPPSGLERASRSTTVPLLRRNGRGKSWHYLYAVRADDRRRRQKLKRRRWLQKLYKEGIAKEKLRPDDDDAENLPLYRPDDEDYTSSLLDHPSLDPDDDADVRFVSFSIFGHHIFIPRRSTRSSPGPKISTTMSTSRTGHPSQRRGHPSDGSVSCILSVGLLDSEGVNTALSGGSDNIVTPTPQGVPLFGPVRCGRQPAIV